MSTQTADSVLSQGSRDRERDQGEKVPTRPDMRALLRSSSTNDGDGLSSRSFIALLMTQFLGTVNDNMFRWFVVPLGKEVISPALALTLGAFCFFLPYLIL